MDDRPHSTVFSTPVIALHDVNTGQASGSSRSATSGGMLDRFMNQALNPTNANLIARTAVSTVFFVNGALFANWVSRIPAVREALNLNKAELGVALLGLAVGALIAFPVAGWGIARFGSRIVTTTAILLMCVALSVVGLAQSLPMLFATLVLLGMGNGATDVGMNAQAVEVEKRHAHPIMSSFHAFWSLGGLAGAGLGSLLVSAGFTPLTHFVLFGMIAALSAGIASSRLLSIPPTHTTDPVFVVPPRTLIAIGMLTFCAALIEGAIADWSGVYLRDTLTTSESFAAIGYAAFSLAMLAGRLLGDGLKARLGAVVLGRSGGITAALGMAFTLLIHQPWASLIGFACVGWGVSSLFPMAFSAAGNAKNVNQGVALAAVATMGYTGFLIGPPVIGFVAHETGLRMALGLLVVLAFVIAVGARVLQASESGKSAR